MGWKIMAKTLPMKTRLDELVVVGMRRPVLLNSRVRTIGEESLLQIILPMPRIWGMNVVVVSYRATKLRGKRSCPARFEPQEM